MAIRFSCSCGQMIAARNEYAGRRVQCNACKKVQTVPAQRGGVPTKLSTSRPTVAPPTPPPPVAPPVAPPVTHTESPLLAQPVTGSTVLRSAAPATMLAQDSRTAGVRFRCLCGAEYQARQEHSGQPARCPYCGEVLFIPSRSAASSGPVLAARDRADRYQPRREGLSTGLRLGLVFLVLLLLGAAGYGAWEFYFKGKAEEVKRERARQANVLDLVPADAMFFASVRVADYVELFFSDRFLGMLDKQLGALPPGSRGMLDNIRKQQATFKKELTAFERRLGFRMAEVERAILVVPDARGTMAWAAVQLKKGTRIDPDKLKHLLGTEAEQTSAGRSYFVADRERGMALLVADDRSFVVASKEGMKAFLANRGGRQGPLSPALQHAANARHTLVVAVNLPQQTLQEIEGAVMQWPAEFRRYGSLLRVKTATLFTENRGTGETVHLEADYGTPLGAQAASRLLPDLLAEAGRALDRHSNEVPPGALDPAKNLLGSIRGTPENSTLRVSMTSEVPGMAIGAVAVGMLLPAVQKVREAAARVQAQNNFKQIALAMMDYADSHGGQLPPPSITDAQGRPLLSWRVALLPYLEGENIYRQFHLNEPWNSPHNRQLIPLMPKVFQNPASSFLPGSGMTFTQVFTGPNTPFPGGRQGLRFPAGFRDGTSNTILVTEGASPVTWTAPQDMPYGPRTNPLTQIGRPLNGQGLVGMADGSVRMLPRNLGEKTLRAAITPAGGETLGPDWDR